MIDFLVKSKEILEGKLFFKKIRGFPALAEQQTFPVNTQLERFRAPIKRTDRRDAPLQTFKSHLGRSAGDLQAISASFEAFSRAAQRTSIAPRDPTGAQRLPGCRKGEGKHTSRSKTGKTGGGGRP